MQRILILTFMMFSNIEAVENDSERSGILAGASGALLGLKNNVTSSLQNIARNYHQTNENQKTMKEVKEEHGLEFYYIWRYMNSPNLSEGKIEEIKELIEHKDGLKKIIGLKKYNELMNEKKPKLNICHKQMIKRMRSDYRWNVRYGHEYGEEFYYMWNQIGEPVLTEDQIKKIKELIEKEHYFEKTIGYEQYHKLWIKKAVELSDEEIQKKQKIYHEDITNKYGIAFFNQWQAMDRPILTKEKIEEIITYLYGQQFYLRLRSWGPIESAKEKMDEIIKHLYGKKFFNKWQEMGKPRLTEEKIHAMIKECYGEKFFNTWKEISPRVYSENRGMEYIEKTINK